MSISVVRGLLSLGGYGRQALSKVLPTSEERVLANLRMGASKIFDNTGAVRPEYAQGFTLDPRRRGGNILQAGRQSGSMMGSLMNQPGQASAGGTVRNVDELIEAAKRPEIMSRLRRGEYVGGWGVDGGIGFDPARRHISRYGAIRSGEKTGQLSGFDLLKGVQYNLDEPFIRQQAGATLAKKSGATVAALAAGAAAATGRGRDFLSGLRGGFEQEGELTGTQAAGALTRATLTDPFLAAALLPFGAATRPLAGLRKALGARGSVGKAFSEAKGRAIGSLFTEAGAPIAPATAMEELAAARARATAEGISLEDALLMGGAKNVDVLGQLNKADYVLDPNAPTESLRLFQNPANPEAASAARASGVLRQSILRDVRGQKFLTTPSPKELKAGTGVRFNEYPADEYSRISPGEAADYVDKEIMKSGRYGLAMKQEDLGMPDKSVIPMETLKDPDKRSALKAKLIENGVRLMLTTKGRDRLAALFWYPNAGKLAASYDNPKQVADVMAALSPSMDWANNIDGAIAMKELHQAGVLDDVVVALKKYDEKIAGGTLSTVRPKIGSKQGKSPADEAADKIVAVMKERLAEITDLNPGALGGTTNNMIKALRILDDPSLGDELLGDVKTRNFSANIMGAVRRVTVDAHAYDSIMGAKIPFRSDRGLTAKSRYDFLAEVYQGIAEALGIPPSAAQAIDWVTWKNLFGEVL